MRVIVAGAVAAAVALGLTVIGAAPTRADTDTDAAERTNDKVVIDRVDVRPSILPGLVRVRVLVSATERRGQRMPTAGARLVVTVPGTQPVFVTGYFATADVELALVVLVPTTLEFEPELEMIKGYLDTDLLAKLKSLGPRLRVQIIGYGGNFSGSKGLVTLEAARKALGSLSGDGSGDPPDLVESLKRAFKSATAGLRAPKNKGALSRAAIVVVSSGVTITAENEDLKDALTKLGDAADKANVRIHTIGYAPVANDGDLRPRRPLLALGELSLKSRGVFRWIQIASGWKDALGPLAEQIALQYVVTFFAPEEEVSGKRLVVGVPVGATATLVDSAPVVIGKARCGRDVCEGNAYCVKDECVQRRLQSGRGALAWVLLVGGVGAGALVVVLGVIALIGRLRRPSGPRPMPTGGHPPGYPGGPGPHGTFTGAPGTFTGVAGGYPAAPPVAAAPVGGPQLIILTGPAAGTRMPLRPGFLIGKAPGSDLDLSHDGFASTNHAHIGYQAGAWTVHDRGSTNGTFSNGVRITETRLDHGMTIRFGSTDVRFIQE